MGESVLTASHPHERHRFVGVLVTLSLLSAGELGFASQNVGTRSASPTAPVAQTTAQQPVQSDMPQVTVLSSRERALRPQANRFVTSVIVRPYGDALDRWNVPICPLVAGLPKALGELVLERISKAAVDANAPLAGRVCDPDLFVVAHDDVGPLLKKWWVHDRTTYDTGSRGVEAVERFFSTKQPIRAWYNTRWENTNGTNCTSGMSAAALGSNLSMGGSEETCNGDDSRLTYSSTGSNIVSAIVVVEMSHMKGMTIRQLADYIAMISLADVRSDADPRPVPSILELFGPGIAPQRLTRWDRALLYSLYNTGHADRLQVSEMETTMVRRIAP